MARAVVESVRQSGRRFDLRQATRADDAQIRRLLREVPMDGPVKVTLRREPSYFASTVVDGPRRQTLVVHDRQQDRIVGAASRSVRFRFVDGTLLAE